MPGRGGPKNGCEAISTERAPTMDTEHQPDANQLLDDAQAAARLGTTPRHLRRLRAEHGLPCVRLGAKVRFLRSDLDDFVSRSRVVAGSGPGEAGAA